MYARSWFMNASTICISVGLAIIFLGVGFQSSSKYPSPELPVDWVLSAVWVSLGGSLCVQWWCWFAAHRCTRVSSYRFEALITNVALLSTAIACLVVGWGSMSFQSFELPPCPCDPGFYGLSCEPCDCSGHGVCDDGVDGTGECFCDARYDGERCNECISTATGYPSCVCERIRTGERCELCAVGFDCIAGTCADGWNQTDMGADGFPICGSCLPGFGGDPTKDCAPCLGGNPPCNGRGTCWDNVNYESRVWDCTGEQCAENIPEGGVKDQCTRTFDVCSTDADCSTSNCRGTCQSRFAPPVGPSAQWSETFDDIPCREDSDCNFAFDTTFEGVLPFNWWDEGRCAERVCCEEARYGNATCFDCVDASGASTIGRMAPACDACPGWNHTVDIDGQTICNGHGTCVPEIDVANEYVGMMCLCSSTWSEADCRCARGPDGLCQSCAQGFYLEADPVKSALAGKGVPKPGPCLPCPGAEGGTGLAACNFMKGYGQCIYADDTTVLDRVGTCACTTSIDAPPQLAATGPECADPPPGFFTRDGNILACPRVLRTGDCRAGARWNSTRVDGTFYETCVEMCGGAFGLVATCDQEGSCACNGTDFIADPDIQGFYEKGFNGLCRKRIIL